MTQPRPSSGFSPYHKRLFVFLSVATFFEGFTAVFLVAALTLILWLLPETGRRELEETARL